MSVLFKYVTTASSYSLCLLISISKGATLVTSPFFIPSALKTLNEEFIGLFCIYFYFTSCLSIPICVHLESTSALTLRFLPFFVFMFAHMFNSLSILLCLFGITYLFFENLQERFLILCLLKIFSKTLLHIVFFVIFFIQLFLNLSFLYQLLFFTVFHNMSLFVTFKILPGFFFFLVLAFFHYMPILVAIEAFCFLFLKLALLFSISIDCPHSSYIVSVPVL